MSELGPLVCPRTEKPCSILTALVHLQETAIAAEAETVNNLDSVYNGNKEFSASEESWLRHRVAEAESLRRTTDILIEPADACADAVCGAGKNLAQLYPESSQLTS